jgi:hypothetical protein
MRRSFLFLLVLAASLCRAQQLDAGAAGAAPAADPARTDFHVKYVSGNDVYIDGGTSSGLAEGTELIIKQNTSLSDQQAANTTIEPGGVTWPRAIWSPFPTPR